MCERSMTAPRTKLPLEVVGYLFFIALPGSNPVSISPSLMSTVPLTRRYSTPTEASAGLSMVARSLIVSGSNTVMSASMPT